MTTWTPTADDRGPDGKIKTQFAAVLNETMVGVGATQTPEAESPTAHPPLPRQQVLLFGAVTALLFGVLLSLLVGSQEAPQTVATPQLTVAPTIRSTVQPAPTAHIGLRQATVAYDAPGGRVLGGVEAGRVFTPTARYGAGWVQVEAVGSGRVWLPASDPALGTPDLSTLRDLTPPTPIPTSAPVYQPAHQAQVPIAAPAEVQATVAPMPTAGAALEPRCGATGWCRRPVENTKRPAPEDGKARG